MEKIKKDDLVKALTDVGFSEEEIEAQVEKAMKEEKLDTEEAPEPKEEEGEDDDEMKKAYNEVMSAKSTYETSMSNFLDRFGKVEGFTTPTEFVTKAVEDDINKAVEDALGKVEKDDLTKSEDFKNDLIKGIVDQFTEVSNSKFEEIQKSITDIQEEVKVIANAPNPVKGVFGSYQKDLIHKSIDEEGRTIVSLSDKQSTLNAFELAKEKATDVKDIDIIKSMIGAYNVSGNVNPKGIEIVKSITNIDFSK